MSINRLYILLLGDDSVGKQSLVDQYIRGDLHGLDDAKDIIFDGETYRLELFSLGSSQINDNSKVVEGLFKGANGFVFVYDMTSPSSINAVESLYALTRREDNEFKPIILFGNKSNLKKERAVSTKRCRRLAKKLRCSSVETSVEDAAGLEEAFMYLTKLVVHSKNQMEKIEVRRLRNPKWREALLPRLPSSPNLPQANSKISTTPRLITRWKKCKGQFVTLGHQAQDLWLKILTRILGFDPQLKFTPIAGLEAFQHPPIPTLSFSL